MSIRDEIDALPKEPKEPSGEHVVTNDWLSYRYRHYAYERARREMAERLLRELVDQIESQSGYRNEYQEWDVEDARAYFAKREAE